jgi:hypothetical protein
MLVCVCVCVSLHVEGGEWGRLSQRDLRPLGAELGLRGVSLALGYFSQLHPWIRPSFGATLHLLSSAARLPGPNEDNEAQMFRASSWRDCDFPAMSSVLIGRPRTPGGGRFEGRRHEV